jgi:anti-sigma factor ChrR (cupin superfamily)
MAELGYRTRVNINDGLRDAETEIKNILRGNALWKQKLGTQEQKRLEKIVAMIDQARDVNARLAEKARIKEEKYLL